MANVDYKGEVTSFHPTVSFTVGQPDVERRITLHLTRGNIIVARLDFADKAPLPTKFYFTTSDQQQLRVTLPLSMYGDCFNLLQRSTKHNLSIFADEATQKIEIFSLE